jgi:hypothetical protein
VPADNAPQADAIVDHPAPDGNWLESEGVPFWIAPDPGGIAPFAGVQEFLVESPQTPVQHSPITNWNPGSPYPGPPAKVFKYVDLESMRWWGRTGQGQLVWSEPGTELGIVPAAIPWDLPQHIDVFQPFWGGYPSMARNRPPAFGDQVATLNPIIPDPTLLAPG